MKVTFLKDFGEHKKGDSAEVDNERAAYWDAVGVAKPAKEKKKVEEAPEKAEIADSAEKAEIAPAPEKKTATKHTAKKKK